MHANTCAENDKPVFWEFLEKAGSGFLSATEQRQNDPEAAMPWKKLGLAWHLLAKGFPPGKKVQWEPKLIESVLEALKKLARDVKINDRQQNVIELTLPGMSKPWVSLFTKRPQGLEPVSYTHLTLPTN